MSEALLTVQGLVKHFPVRSSALRQGRGGTVQAVDGVSLVVRMMVGGMWPGWSLVLAPLFETLLWPVASVLLLAPQRRAPDRDANRPL